MHGLKERVSQIVMQPTTLCNLNCGYCYLPNRRDSSRMNPAVAASVAADLPKSERPLPISWHAGEPLASGCKAFAALLAPFQVHCEAGTIQHVIQTNATLLTEQWIELLRENGFVIGVSLDGDAALNRNRVDWSGNESWSRTMRGIELLRKREVPFHAIAVVKTSALENAGEIFRFFCDLGCSSLGINIEETVGTHFTETLSEDSAVRRFWGALFTEWQANPVLEVREIRHLLSWMRSIVDGELQPEPTVDLLPSVAHSGDVVLLSPEFVGVSDSIGRGFVVGNVLRESLSSILARSASIPYVADYASGVKRCHSTCEYFGGCGGRSAANKYFETGSTDATLTRYCANSTQLPLQAILDSLT
jgi:uncharacterized protein